MGGSNRYQGQRQGHAAILARFEADLREIAAIELHPAARTDALKRMSDLVPVDKLRDWVDHCQKGHDTFVEKVSILQPATESMIESPMACFCCGYLAACCSEAFE